LTFFFQETVTGFFSSLFLFASLSTRETTRKEKKRKIKKLPKIFGRYALKFLPLHPLSEKNSNRETSDL